MKIAVEGCCHGELDAIYDHIATLERKDPMQKKVDLLLICGDFQAVRNHADLQCMAVPQKYRKLGGFYKYYIGQKTAPLLTIVIGGNHEASNYMWELYHGGWLAPNIYFLGFSGCVQVNGIRIAGASGIYKANHYNLGHYERLPYDNSSIRSIYHTRQFDIFKLSHLSPTPNSTLFLSHDWPNTIEHHGELATLLRHKPFFAHEANARTLGSPPLMELLKTLRPQRWFSAHLHCRYEAVYRHGGGGGDGLEHDRNGGGEGGVDGSDGDGNKAGPAYNPDEIMLSDIDDGDGDGTDEAALKPNSKPPPILKSNPLPTSHPTPKLDLSPSSPPIDNPDEIVIDDIDEDFKRAAQEDVTLAMETSVPLETGNGRGLPARNQHEHQGRTTPHETRFLALDKCLPRRRFLEVIDVPAPSPPLPPSSSASQPPSLRLTFDPEWLAITRALHPFFSTTFQQSALPTPAATRALVDAELQWVRENVGEGGVRDVGDVQVFRRTAPGPEGGQKNQNRQPCWYTNPQTEAFAQMLQIPNKVNPVPAGMAPPRMVPGTEGDSAGETLPHGGWSPSRIVDS